MKFLNFQKNMRQKKSFLLCAAIAVLLAGALLSCEKDSYQKSPITETFFKVVDETHINTYDQLDILVEENKEVSYEIRTQDDLLVKDTISIAEGESMERSFVFGTMYLEEDMVVEEDGNVLFTFQYQDAKETTKNRIRVLGMMIKSKTNDYLLCKSNVVLKATLLPSEMEGEEKVFKILYELKCDTLVLASATQKVCLIDL